MKAITNPGDPDEDYLTEEEDFNQEEENDRNEIRVGNDVGEPDPEDESLRDDPFFDDLEEDDLDDDED